MSGEAIYCRNTFQDVAIPKSKEDLLQLLLQSQKLKSKTPLDGGWTFFKTHTTWKYGDQGLIRPIKRNIICQSVFVCVFPKYFLAIGAWVYKLHAGAIVQHRTHAPAFLFKNVLKKHDLSQLLVVFCVPHIFFWLVFFSSEAAQYFRQTWAKQQEANSVNPLIISWRSRTRRKIPDDRHCMMCKKCITLKNASYYCVRPSDVKTIKVWWKFEATSDSLSILHV